MRSKRAKELRRIARKEAVDRGTTIDSMYKLTKLAYRKMMQDGASRNELSRA